MFIQVITGQAVDRDALDRQAERWANDVQPGAIGFLGSTSGVTDDGRFVTAARFESEDAARRNSDRPEQSAWWAETEKCVRDVQFFESERVIPMFGGGSNDAQFVQVMRGRLSESTDVDQYAARMGETESTLRAHRPDLIGGLSIIGSGGSFFDLTYFTTEEEARAGEAKEMPPEVAALFEEFASSGTVDEYYDLKNPSFR